VESLPLGDPENPDCAILSVGCLFLPISNPFAGIITDPNSGLSSAKVQYQQLLLPHPQFTGVSTEPQMVANSTYHALQLVAEKRYSNGLQLLVTYTWSKSIDDSSNADDNVTWLGSFTSLQNPNKPWLERSLSTFDIPQVVQFSYSYNLPFGRGRAFLGNMPRALDMIVGGWITNGIWRIADGRPLTFSVADGNPLPTYGGQRPNIVGTPKRNHGPDWVDNYFADNSVFQRPDDFTLGDAPRALGGVNASEVQVVTVFANTGTFSLTFNGQTTGLSLAETIQLLSSAEYFIGIMSGPIHLAAALDIKLICVTNFPPPELICLPCLKDIDQVESEWFYPQSVILHQDDDGKFVKRLTTENLHRALDGDIYPYWSDRYLELIQD
jgi:hypothetical protein